MRKEYLKSVLRQDVRFFDTNAVSSTTYDVITAITADAYVIQDVLSDKVNLSFLPLSLQGQETPLNREDTFKLDDLSPPHHHVLIVIIIALSNQFRVSYAIHMYQ